jgi:hypothetical protein
MRVPVAVLMQKKRQRVCESCVKSSDDKIGAVHSELPCARCACSPCWGFIVDPAGPAIPTPSGFTYVKSRRSRDQIPLSVAVKESFE